MSVVVSTCAQIAQSPLNRSSAKQLFSFPKAPRFRPASTRNAYQPLLSPSCDSYYNLPTTRLQRATNFGYGGRLDVARRNASPPPNTYALPSDFDKGQKKGHVFSFGISREAYAKVYMKAHPAPDPNKPGPGTYEVRKKPGTESVKFSFRPRTNAPCTLLLIL